MRIAAWTLIVCTAIGVIAVFLSSVELRVAGVALGRRTSLSLYQAAADRELIRRAVVGYHHNSRHSAGKAILATFEPHVRGKVHEVTDDARSALDSLDELTEDDAHTLGVVLRATVWVMLGLHALLAALVLPDLVMGAIRRSRAISAVVIAALIVAVAIVVHVALREVVWEANDDVGRDLVAIGVGGYLIPIAAVVALGAAVAVVVTRGRTAAVAYSSR